MWASAAVAMLLAGTPAQSHAKSASWSAAPQYSSMEILTPGAYKVKRGIYSGVIDGNGNEIIKMTTDSITPFVGGHALVLTPSGDNSFRLQAILSDDLRQQPVYEEVWVEDYPFFSDGLLPVRNGQGFYGYMDESARMVLKPSYINIHPFHEGLAAVTKRPSNVVLQFLSKAADKVMEQFKKKVTLVYINRGGQELKLQKSLGKIANGSTFNNGIAFVENKDGERFLINPQGAVVKRVDGVDPEFDDRYVYIDDDYDDHSDFEALTRKDSEVDNSVQPFSENGKWGFRDKSGAIILPAQFEDVDMFADGFAMAKIGNKWGLLKLENGDISLTAPVAATTRKTRTKKAAAAPAKGFKVTVPDKYKSSDLTLTLVDANGNKTTETVNGQGDVNLSFATLAKPSGAYSATLNAKDLVLWSQKPGESASDIAANSDGTRVRIAISPSSAKADIKDNAVVTVTFTNPGDQDVTTSVNVTGRGLTPVSRSLTIPAHGSKRVSTNFTKVYEKEVRGVSATAGNAKAYKNITVSPFYVKF